MASGAAQATPSPSASSIFLPLGRLSRSGSKSSLSNPVNRDTLNEALDSIHSAACQSQSLTVFNEYTTPPPATSAVEVKGLAGELQGGFTGLYNKLIASVSGSKEGAETAEKSAPDQIPRTHDEFHTRETNQSAPPIKSTGTETKKGHTDGRSSAPGSNRPSRLQSPILGSFEPTIADDRTKSSKFSSRAPSTASRGSIPSTPALKSPTFLPQKHLNNIAAEPSIAEVNANAVQELKTHSRNTSHHEHLPSHALNNDKDSHPSLHGDNLRKVATSSIVEGPISTFAQGRPVLPYLATISGSERQKGGLRISHERENSQASTSSNVDHREDVHRSDEKFDKANEVLLPATDAQALGRVLMHKHERSAASTYPDSRPLSMSDKAIDSRLQKSSKSNNVQTPKSPSSPAHRPIEGLSPRISQSRLPGFGLARTSSSDSTFTGQGSEHVTFAKAEMDGARDVLRSDRQPPRAALHKLRSRLLNKEFWMRDENAKDCFHCGEPFSTFRRKHHCRTCGQIFDSKWSAVWVHRLN